MIRSVRFGASSGRTAPGSKATVNCISSRAIRSIQRHISGSGRSCMKRMTVFTSPAMSSASCRLTESQWRSKKM